MSHRLRIRVLLGLIAVLSAGLAVAVVPQATADINYDGSAAANAFDVTLANQSIPLGLVLEGEGPLAQARQTSLDTSDAFAAFPYPGDTAAQVPGLLGGLVGVALPPYPLAAQTSSGDKPASTSYPGIELSAQSADTLTQSAAVVGSAASGGASRAQVLRSESGAVSATSSGDANGLVVGNVLTVSGAHAEAVVRRDENGALTREGHLSFAHLAVPGLMVTIPTQTPTSVPIPPPLPQLPPFPAIPLPLGGQTVPAPDLAFRDGQFGITLPGLGSTRYAVPAQAVLDGLATAGIKADYQAVRKTQDGVVSPGLVLTTTIPAPPDNPAGISGKSVVTMTFGLATAHVAASVLPDDGSVPAVEVGLPTGSEPASATDPVLASGPVPGLLDAGVPPVVGAPQEAAPGSLEGLQLTRLGKAQDLSWLYLLIAASALLCFASTTILRYLGVRVRWHS